MEKGDGQYRWPHQLFPAKIRPELSKSWTKAAASVRHWLLAMETAVVMPPGPLVTPSRCAVTSNLLIPYRGLASVVQVQHVTTADNVSLCSKQVSFEHRCQADASEPQESNHRDRIRRSSWSALEDANSPHREHCSSSQPTLLQSVDARSHVVRHRAGGIALRALAALRQLHKLQRQQWLTQPLCHCCGVPCHVTQLLQAYSI